MTCAWSTGSGKRTGHGPHTHKKKQPDAPVNERPSIGNAAWVKKKTFDGFLPAMQRTGRTKKPPSGTMNGATRWRAGRPSGAWCGCPLNAAASTAASHRRTRTIRSDASLSLAAGGRNSLKFGAKFSAWFNCFWTTFLTRVQFESEVFVHWRKDKIFAGVSVSEFSFEKLIWIFKFGSPVWRFRGRQPVRCRDFRS